MSNLNWQQHDADIVKFVRRVTDFYLRTEASTGELLAPGQGLLLRNNYATPRLMLELIKYLQKVTGQVNSTLRQIRALCIQGGMDVDTCKAGSTTYGPMLTDYQKWDARLGGYVELTEAAFDRNPDASGDEDPIFWDTVTKPLLTGFFPGQKRQRTLDAVTPLVLAWQIEVASSAFKSARVQFWKDLNEQAKKVGAAIADFGGAAILIVLGAAALGYGLSR